MLGILSDAAWTRSRVDTLPPRWAKRLLRKWELTQASDYYRANVELRESTESLLRVRIPLDASDADICEAAKQLADRCMGRAALFRDLKTLRASMERICTGQGIEPPHVDMKDPPAVARMICPLWWRRKLRKHQGRTVEAAAIQLGRVSKNRDPYVSNEGLRARLQQNARNAASLESTIARNELGQEFTLAELAATSTANKSIRRGELMARIAGFERIALANAHAGLFLTMTCPSRFHKCRLVNDGRSVIENPNYAPTENPRTAQAYLQKVWSCIRAELKRRELGVYGFRIAEPQHDGTPHWHLLLFCDAQQVQAIEGIVRKHCLKDSPDEPGAREHRCDIKRIDWNKGSAAGYVAKYVSKNIDGEHVGQDLDGRPAKETALRVEAWASRWGIRQFQQIGGPPVGVWRELRRVRSLPAGAPKHLRDAHAAANKANEIKGRQGPCVAWDRYCEAQGGVFCGRKARIKLMKVAPEKLGRYGDEQAARPVGIETLVKELMSTATDAGSAYRLVYWSAESTRHDWEIVRKAGQTAHEGFPEGRAMPATPWTSVNNCTDERPENIAPGRIREGVTTAEDCGGQPYPMAPMHDSQSSDSFRPFSMARTTRQWSTPPFME